MISNKSALSLGLCPIHAGAKQPIVHVCTDESCTATPLICVLCKIGSHAGHTTISVGQFAEDVDQLRFSQGGSRTAKEVLGKIKDTRASCLAALKRTKESILTAIDKAESELIKQLQKTQHKSQTLLGQFTRQFQSLAVINWEAPFQTLATQIKTHKQKLSANKAIRSDLQQQFSELDNEVTSISSKLQEALSQIVDFANLKLQIDYSAIPKSCNSPINWSTSLKHADIQLTDSTITKINNDSFSFCLGDWQMSDRNGHPYRWQIEVVNNNQSIYIGMCQPKAAIDHSYSMVGWEWSSVGHGAYAAGYTYTYSTYDASENHKANNIFQFGTGDVIGLQYDPKRCILTFKKGSDKKELKVEPAKGETYRAMAMLYITGDSIKIRKWQQ